jgi:hypothetical protein
MLELGRVAEMASDVRGEAKADVAATHWQELKSATWAAQLANMRHEDERVVRALGSIARSFPVGDHRFVEAIEAAGLFPAAGEL